MTRSGQGDRPPDAAATAAAAQAVTGSKRGRGRPRKQDAAAAANASEGNAAAVQVPRRESPMDAMPFAERALGVLNMGERERRAEQRVCSRLNKFKI